MTLLFLYGPPAAGKLTVAREVAGLTGFSVFHNHLTIELAREVLPEPSTVRSELISTLRLATFEAASKAGVSLIFTFVYAAGDDDAFVAQIVEIVERYGGRICFVQLLASRETLLTRLSEPSRLGHSKIKRPEILESILATKDLLSPVIYGNHLTLDTDEQNPQTAARRIVEHFGLDLTPEAVLRDMYDAFNRRDVEGVLSSMAPDVEWPNDANEGWIQGHEAVRAYWTHRLGVIDSRVEPLSFEFEPDGHLVVRVRQVMRDLQGNLLSEDRVIHAYAFVKDKVRRMDIR
ncbi:hypothetical protein EON81_15175 [bacterium]|nr:MAG: hypothetical protein EON81_15175 [bacterium]